VYIDENGCSSDASNSIVGLEDLTGLAHHLTVYPNPNNGNFEIRFADVSGIMNISMTNALGQIVYTSKVQANANSTEIIQLGGIETGAYQLKVEGNSGVSVHSIIIE